MTGLQKLHNIVRTYINFDRVYSNKRKRAGVNNILNHRIKYITYAGRDITLDNLNKALSPYGLGTNVILNDWTYGFEFELIRL